MAGYVRADERRAQLLQAAQRVLVRDGYDRLALRTVAAEADVRLSTLQYIFRTRTELVQAMAQNVLDESGFSAHEPRDRGLAVELPAAMDWYTTRLLTDARMAELLRAEFIANLRRHAPGEEIEYPAGRPLLGGLLRRWLQRIADDSGETYAWPIPALASLCVHSTAGLTYKFLRDGDLEAFRAEAQFFTDRVVEIADPRPAGG